MVHNECVLPGTGLANLAQCVKEMTVEKNCLIVKISLSSKCERIYVALCLSNSKYRIEVI